MTRIRAGARAGQLPGIARCTIAIVLAGVMMSACAADSALEPHMAAARDTVPATPALHTPSGARLAGLLEAIADVRTRELPAFAGRAAPARIDGALEALVASLVASDPVAVTRSVAEARAAIDGHARLDDAGADAAALDVLRLVIDQLGTLMHAPAAARAVRDDQPGHEWRTAR